MGGCRHCDIFALREEIPKMEQMTRFNLIDWFCLVFGQNAVKNDVFTLLTYCFISI
jgi:hypothetical protein